MGTDDSTEIWACYLALLTHPFPQGLGRNEPVSTSLNRHLPLRVNRPNAALSECRTFTGYLLLLFDMTRSFVKSVMVLVVVVANTRINPTDISHRYSCDRSVGCALQANKCLTSCGEAPHSVQMTLGSPNTLCL